MSERKAAYSPLEVNLENVSTLPCETCGKPGSERQQFIHQRIRMCYVCAMNSAASLATEGHELGCSCAVCGYLFVRWADSQPLDPRAYR